MKIIVFSDLHFSNKFDFDYNKKIIKDLMENDIELVVICGDIFESGYDDNPYHKLNSIFGKNIPVICVLGNHEFFGRTVDETLNFYSEKYNPKKYNVHYLDVIGHYDIGKYRFFGNVLWYDGSMSVVFGQDPNIFYGNNWSWGDRHIKDFSCLNENKKCVKQIMDNHGGDEKINILCTHCCPHEKLNLHMNANRNYYNIFSGMKDFLIDVRPDYAFCGHTHLRTVGDIIHGCKCVNVGSDMDCVRSFVIEI